MPVAVEVLYQGYWPESLTALPSPQACGTASPKLLLMGSQALEELREIKEMGFNLVRVHATAARAVGRWS